MTLLAGGLFAEELPALEVTNANAVSVYVLDFLKEASGGSVYVFV